MAKNSIAVNPLSVNKVNIDRGCDLESGCCWARYGDQYASFRTASERDQWINGKVCKASKLSNDDPKLLAESIARNEQMEIGLYGKPRRMPTPKVITIAATGEKTAYTLACEASARMARAFVEMGKAERAWHDHPKGANLSDLSWKRRAAIERFQAEAFVYATFAGRM